MIDKPLTGWEVLLAWLLLAVLCVAAWWAFFVFVLFPWGTLFRMGSIR
jgi:hypothetical protein